MSRYRVVLLQLPIPQPPGAEVREENIPLAAGYLKQAAYQAGLTTLGSAASHSSAEATDFDIDIVQPGDEEYRLCDAGVVAAILRRQPQIVGFSCFLWNIERTLELAKRLKEQCPELVILLGGPEITTDNERILRTEVADFICIGEGEETFVRFLRWFLTNRSTSAIDIPLTSDPNGVARTVSTLMSQSSPSTIPGGIFLPYSPSNALDPWTSVSVPVQLGNIESPYRSGILPCGPEYPLFLETMRGCCYRCRFCYYPKGFAEQSYLPLEEVDRMVSWACERGVQEIVLLDPTLNQRPDFIDFLEIFAKHNRIERRPDGTITRRFSLFGELRAESVTQEIAELLAAAGFYEVEVGLQTVDPTTQRLAGRHVNLPKLEVGCRELRRASIQVRIDLILGLPGDTVESIRRGFDQLEAMREQWTEVQIFHLSVLPGTEFRRHAAALGLRFQPRPPYTILETQTLQTQDLIDLFQEAEERFRITFDLPPLPTLPRSLTRSPRSKTTRTVPTDSNMLSEVVVDLDHLPNLVQTEKSQNIETHISSVLPAVIHRGGHLILIFRSLDFSKPGIVPKIQQLIRQVLTDSPHTSCEIFLIPAAHEERLTPEILETLLATCYETTSYLDFFYALSPEPLNGAKRLVVVLPLAQRMKLGLEWVDQLGESAFILWTGHVVSGPSLEELAPFEVLAEEETAPSPPETSHG
ncbi:MAG: radical SAM protein [Thermoguttaceae bacterium]|nr:radical SAM protein [Thermoguttaceae bacterium]